MEQEHWEGLERVEEEFMKNWWLCRIKSIKGAKQNIKTSKNC